MAEILQVDANTVRNHFKCYRVDDGLAGLNRVGDGVGSNPCLLTEEQFIAGSTIALFKQLEAIHLTAVCL